MFTNESKKKNVVLYEVKKQKRYKQSPSYERSTYVHP